MHYLDYHEQIPHRTGDFPLDYYYVEESFPRYRMTMHWHKETEIIRVRSGRLRLFLDDGELLAEAGDLLTVGGGVIHGGEPEMCVYECIVFDPQALSPGIESCRQALLPLLRNNIFLKNRSIEADAQFRSAVNRLFELAATDFSACSIDMLGAVFAFLGAQLRNIGAAQLHTVSDRTWQKAERSSPRWSTSSSTTASTSRWRPSPGSPASRRSTSAATSAPSCTAPPSTT